MHIEFLVEELSAESALTNLLPKILGATTTYTIHPYQGKPDLLRKLPGRLKGYQSWLPDDWRLVVLVDADSDDCKRLKAQLETAAQDAGLITKSSATSGKNIQVLNRLAIEELEAWFFGDVEALCAAYSRINPNLGKQSRYRDPDAIAGGTWEALERVLQRAGHYSTGISKIAVAQNVSKHMNPARNRSKSFQVFRDGLQELLR